MLGSWVLESVSVKGIVSIMFDLPLIISDDQDFELRKWEGMFVMKVQINGRDEVGEESRKRDVGLRGVKGVEVGKRVVKLQVEFEDVSKVSAEGLDHLDWLKVTIKDRKKVKFDEIKVRN